MKGLALKINEHIRANAETFSLKPPVWTANECELAAEVQRLDAKCAGIERAMEAVKDDSGLATDLQAVRDACADRIEAAVNASKNQKDLLTKLGDLVIAMRARG